MEYRRLGRTDLQVSAIGLGTMTWGEQNTEAEAHRQMDLALDHGVTFWDAAEMYPVPPRAETYGRTEEIIGSWLKRHGRRDRLVLASKVAGPDERLTYIRDGKPRLDRRHIPAALEASLRRLQTDYIDLYQLHWPDRDTNIFGQLGYDENGEADSVPLAETLDVLADLVRSGKVRAIGLSNETAWGAMRFLALAEDGRGPRMVSIQNPYSLLNRSFEVGLAEVAVREQCGLLAYSPLAMGVLSGKYLGGANPPGSRLARFPQFQRYRGPQAEGAAAAYVALAREHGLDPAQMALAYVTSRPFVTSTIIGATNLEQLATDIASIDVTLSEEVLDGIEAIHRVYTYPCP
ncbi:NADP(H)-dependent aldo-keto reductase [Rhodospirillaceae bacterium SYSU D60014]|uniref:NADP(H)-dependent aldo-keto reductase n=1 Tax=Virgifigura deserti TaxID=2268457 RepID=UPI000E665C85